MRERRIRITSGGDVAERQARDTAASLGRLRIPERGAGDRNRAQADNIAASLAPGSSGEPLASAVREPFERRLGHDFSHVRIHADGAAGSSARDLDARAYTVGRHVMFDAGRYAPDTAEGQRLLAHELTHVAQADAAAEPVISRAPNDPKEIMAGQTTDKFISEDVGELLDKLIAASKVLAPFIGKSKVRAIKGSISVLGPAEYSYQYHEEGGTKSEYKGSEKDPAIKESRGFTQKKEPHNIILRQQISNVGDALHEAIHRVSFPGFTTVNHALDEGATEYFTRQVLKEAELDPPKNKYDRQVKSVEQLIGLVGEPLVGEAYFDAKKIQNLGNAMGATAWLAWTQAMGKKDYDAADALIVREKLKRQLKQRIQNPPTPQKKP